uniref:(northern house mosquito) hypothetical protein n=1 Tax=Culex pipiens TaxID=7175 RepID=A0A8D8DYR0_CULPI
MGACWTAGSSASRWPATDGQPRQHVDPAAAVADGTAEEAVAANGADPAIGAPVVGRARWSEAAEVVADVAAVRTPAATRAAVTGPARAANRPVARTRDRAAPLTAPTTKAGARICGKDRKSRLQLVAIFKTSLTATTSSAEPLIQPNNATAAKL